MGTKVCPGDYDCYAKAADDEPIFTLRAKDPKAPELVEYWAVRTYPREKRKDPKYLEAIACADAMRTWQDEHGVKRT